MGRKISRTSLAKKGTVVAVLIIATTSCYAGINFTPMINAMAAGFEQMKSKAADNIAKLTGIEKVGNDNLLQSRKIADLSQILGETLGVPLQLPNAEMFKLKTANWMQDFVTDPKRMFGSAAVLETATPTSSFGSVNNDDDLKINFTNTHRQVESRLVARNDSPAEARRLAELREYMVEDSTITGVALSTVNKQTITKSRNKIKNIADQAAMSKSLREDAKATNDYLMVVALELVNIRELQAQQLELLSSFARTFSEPQSHLKKKDEFRKNFRDKR